jgi:hypothetical protein
MWNFVKIRPVGAELFHADSQTERLTDGRTDRQTDITKLTVAFNNYILLKNMNLKVIHTTTSWDIRVYLGTVGTSRRHACDDGIL